MIRMARAAADCESLPVPLPPLARSITDGAERILDRVLCAVGAIGFSQFPEFIQQYLQRLEGHLDEARLAVDRFKDAAAQSGMTLDQLIAGASQNPDPSIGKLGEVVRLASVRVSDLASADAAPSAGFPLDQALRVSPACRLVHRACDAFDLPARRPHDGGGAPLCTGWHGFRARTLPRLHPGTDYPGSGAPGCCPASGSSLGHRISPRSNPWTGGRLAANFAGPDA